MCDIPSGGFGIVKCKIWEQGGFGDDDFRHDLEELRTQDLDVKVRLKRWNRCNEVGSDRKNGEKRRVVAPGLFQLERMERNRGDVFCLFCRFVHLLRKG